MPLTEPHRTTVRDRLRPVIADDSALEALMSLLPATDGDSPATRDFVRAEIHAATVRTLTIMITAMIALTGVTVGVLSTLIASLP
jgi:hypothetical protein